MQKLTQRNKELLSRAIQSKIEGREWVIVDDTGHKWYGIWSEKQANKIIKNN